MRKPILFIVLVFIIGAILLTLIMSLVGFNGPQFKIFANMDELSFLDSYCVGYLDDNESLTEGLYVTDRKCIEVEYNGVRFQVYAYVFRDKSDAKAYFDRVKDELKSINGWYYRIYQSNKAFFAHGPSKGSRSFNAFLYNHFSSTVKELD